MFYLLFRLLYYTIISLFALIMSHASKETASAVKIVTVDFYMSSPIQNLDILYSEFRGASVFQVPVLRIFGSTEQAKKICVHIHGVFPYFYIPYYGTGDPNVLKYQIAAHIDRVVNISFGQASSSSQHVYKITLVSGIPFYGYHSRDHQFFKIFLYNPLLIRKVSNILQTEAILGQIYQPHETHIPFQLQFMIDYNLHGMSKILLENVQFRLNNGEQFGDLKYLPPAIHKMSFCELEADAIAGDILNRKEVECGDFGVNPGIAALWEDERQRRRNKNQESQIQTCLTMKNFAFAPTKSHLLFKQALMEKLLLRENPQQNDSVYPAETPNDTDLLDASAVDFSSLTDLSEIDLDSTLDPEAEKLLEVLHDLGEKVEFEEDSVLSQVQDRDEEEDEVDLSAPLPASTPVKVDFLKDGSDEDLWSDESLDKTILPQLDGNCDSSSDEDNLRTVRKRTKIIDKPDDSLMQVKRKLKFSNENPDHTICEDIIECRMKVKKPIAETISKLNKAELYDLTANYKPKEGCSTVLTQSSAEITSSLESNSIFSTPEGKNGNCKIDSSDSDLAPYQRISDIMTTKLLPPSRNQIAASFEELHIPKFKVETAFYEDVDDCTGNVEVGYSVLKISSRTTSHLEDFKTLHNGLENVRKSVLPMETKWSYENVKRLKLSYSTSDLRLITTIKNPPSSSDVRKWTNPVNDSRKGRNVSEATRIIIPSSLDESELELSLSPVEKRDDSARIMGVSLNNTYGFRLTPENFQNVKMESELLTIISMEVHTHVRGELKPDPSVDPIRAVFYSIEKQEERVESGIIAVRSIPHEISILSRCRIFYVENEEQLVGNFIDLIRKWDPDIFLGYEIEMLSWGYLIERGSVLNFNLLNDLSRTISNRFRNQDDEKLKITGRIVLDAWRLMRHEISLQSYTFENIVYHMLHKRIPLYSFKDLSFWWDHKSAIYRHRTVNYYLARVEYILEILQQQDLIGRTSELARLFGIQFYEVLSRGSQFRVESMMLRLAKPLNYIPVSPSVQQRSQMKAPEFLPLILEPESKMYDDPVIVLDFQSLYPSMIIAYNYCFSTCVGRVVNLGKNAPFEFGATQYKISRGRIQKLLDKDCLNFSPCGVGFVKAKIRDGILPRMLREILNTRLMVKNSMKENKNDKILQKILHNRQLGLKLIANVTYGYTAANFSGRMPAVELADSVVSKGRETLQRAISLVESTPEWKAKVVYGDTDSLFVLVPGKSRAEAFAVGKKIADAVTSDNPDPVKLKLEKVYQPCILQTKKRYVGYMYESSDQSEPVYDAKGIETVRRDGCPAVSKMLEKCLRLLFDTKNVSLVKKYVLKQFYKILSGRVSLQDLTFAKEYRGASGYRAGACVPSLELARKWKALDKRNEPRSGERVPYVIANGPPGLPLIRLVRSPREFFNDPSLRPNAVYYITKVVIPPLNRCFNLIGADLGAWYSQMPRKQFQYLPGSSPGKKSTISQYFLANICAVCGQQAQEGVCPDCKKKPQETVVILNERIRNWEQNYQDAKLICQSCTRITQNSTCISLDCPVIYRVEQTSRDFQQVAYVRELLSSI